MIDFREPFFSRLVYFQGDIRLATYGLGIWQYNKDKIGEFKILDVRKLRDDDSNSLEDYKRLIDEGCQMLDKHRKVVIGCLAGISRSNAIAMGILMQKYGLSFEEAFDVVSDRIKNCLIEPSHLEALKALYPPSR